VKVTSRNFGRDRRYPITNRFSDSGKALPEPDRTLISRAGRASADAFEG
jgi:NAD+ synthase